MIEVFFCTMPTDMVRKGMADACLARWRELAEQGHCKVQVLRPEAEESFQLQRRMKADQLAKGDIYIVTDDDMMPLVEDLYEAEAVMRRHPHFAKLAFLPTNANISHWTPENYSAYEDDEVMEHVSVGGCYMTRKGALSHWPKPDNPRAFDSQHGIVLRDFGWRVGFFKHIRANHFGEGLSTVWPSARRRAYGS